MRVLLVALMVAGFAAPAAAAGSNYQVRHNPYAEVDWGTTLRCQSQHHDHVTSGTQVNNYDTAGYCAITWMDYGGACNVNTGDAWAGIGRPDPDPGVPFGFWGFRRWPPTDFGAPAIPGTYSSLKFYIPGAEEVGAPISGPAIHTFSLGLTTYIDSEGCVNCAPSTDVTGEPGTANTVDGCAGADGSYNTAQGMIDRINELGAHAILNHNGSTAYQRLGSLEIYNNLNALQDQAAGTTTNIDAYQAGWDGYNDREGGMVWGTAVNDRYGNSALVDGVGGGDLCSPNCTGVDGDNFGAADIDRGKLEVLLPSYDFAAYFDAYQRGAFFAVVENNATKAAYPQVTDIDVTSTGVTITTVAGDEDVTWKSNGGATVGVGFSFDFEDLPARSTWLRAEIDDGAGRTLFTQPIALETPGTLRRVEALRR